MIGALLLLIVANAAPWAAGRLLGRHWSAPIDGGASFADGTRVLGDHKTWRGLMAGAAACGLTAQFLGYGASIGVAFGVLSLTADALTSFVKRRLRMVPGAEVPGMDQLPEALVPTLLLYRPLGLEWGEAILVGVVFFLLDIAVTRVRHPG